MISPDETLVKHGVDAGASGGTAKLVIVFAKNGVRVPANSAAVTGPLSNLWITVINEPGDACAGLEPFPSTKGK